MPRPHLPASTSALRYWEPRRIPYNLVLLAVFIRALWPRWSALRDPVTPRHLLQLLVLAALANLCYSAAYLADLAAQGSGLQQRWPRWRGTLWLAGTLFATLLTLYWTLDEILPDLIGS